MNFYRILVGFFHPITTLSNMGQASVQGHPRVSRNVQNLKLRFKTNVSTECSKKIQKVAVAKAHAINVS